MCSVWFLLRVFRPFEMRLEASVLSTVRRKVERPGFYIVHRNQQVLVKLVSTRLINSYGVSVASPPLATTLPLLTPLQHRLHLRSGPRYWYWYRSWVSGGYWYGSCMGSAIGFGYGMGIVADVSADAASYDAVRVCVSALPLLLRQLLLLWVCSALRDSFD